MTDEIKRVQKVLELVRAALRNDIVPGSVVVPILNHCIDSLMADYLTEEETE